MLLNFNILTHGVFNLYVSTDTRRLEQERFVIGCTVPLLSLVLSGDNDHDGLVGAVDPGQLPLALRSMRSMGPLLVNEVGRQA